MLPLSVRNSPIISYFQQILQANVLYQEDVIYKTSTNSFKNLEKLTYHLNTDLLTDTCTELLRALVPSVTYMLQ